MTGPDYYGRYHVPADVTLDDREDFQLRVVVWKTGRSDNCQHADSATVWLVVHSILAHSVC